MIELPLLHALPTGGGHSYAVPVSPDASPELELDVAGSVELELALVVIASVDCVVVSRLVDPGGSLVASPELDPDPAGPPDAGSAAHPSPKNPHTVIAHPTPSTPPECPIARRRFPAISLGPFGESNAFVRAR